MEIKRSKPRQTQKVVIQPESKIAADIIRYGISNENAARVIEKDNTLIFVCDKKATKPQIKQAVETLYKVVVKKVRTLISIKGYKKAFVVLKDEGVAMKIATEAGII